MIHGQIGLLLVKVLSPNAKIDTSQMPKFGAVNMELNISFDEKKVLTFIPQCGVAI